MMLTLSNALDYQLMSTYQCQHAAAAILIYVFQSSAVTVFEIKTETAVLIQNRTETKTSKFCRLTNGFISDTPQTKIRLC